MLKFPASQLLPNMHEFHQIPILSACAVRMVWSFQYRAVYQREGWIFNVFTSPVDEKFVGGVCSNVGLG